ncbi:MAG: glycosyltransferase family 87 protein [Candidatus Binataceae bacterium]
MRLPERVGRADFSSYYASAWALRMGANPYTENLDAAANALGLDLGPLNHAAYTPTFLLCFEPMTLLRPHAAYWSWQALNAVALIVAMMLLFESGVPSDRRRALVLAPLMLLYPPLADHFAFAQCQLLVLLMLVLMMRWMARGWDARAGLILALAGLLRAFPLVIGGYLLLRRRWTACLWLSIGLAAGAALTFAIVGPRCLDFRSGMEFARGYEFLALPVNVSVAAISSRLFWYTFGPVLSPTLETARALVVVIADLLVVVITVQATFAMNGRRDHDWRLLSLWIAAAILLSPTAWLHYMVLLFIPFAAMSAAASRGALSPRAAMTAVASYVLSLISCLGMSCLTVLGSPRMQSLGRGPAWRVLDFHGWLILAKEECAFVALLLAYMAIYWFVVDSIDAPDEESRLVSVA